MAAFYPDMMFETTTVMGEAPLSAPSAEVTPYAEGGEKILFRTSGRVIVDEGWKVVYRKTAVKENEDEAIDDNSSSSSLPIFSKGEHGPHVPSLAEKWTQPPKPYPEATLLGAMEPAGKFVDNDELRDAMKENGIGRPSTRAAIIETLFRRHYIRKERKNLVATPTGVELIELIREELLKSPELTGIWEKKLRDIEHRTYNPGLFIRELKEQIQAIVCQVLSDNSNRRVTVIDPEEDKKQKKKAVKPAKVPRQAKVSAKSSSQASTSPVVGSVCPLCGKGTIIKGKTAYGCSNWASGCSYRVPFE